MSASLNAETEWRAADWLSRQQFEDWNEAEQAKLDAWLAESDNHVAAYWRLAAAFRRTDRLAALRGQAIDAATPARHTRDWRIVSAVAVSAFLVAGGAAAYLFPADRGETFSTAVGGRTALTLADGSQVDLNTDTILKTDIGAHARNIELVRGEAYFQVKHDPARPFVVTVAGHRITDLGTKFFVRTVARGLEVALVEGRARLENANGNIPSSAILSPGDLVVATADSMNVSRKHVPELADDLAWRRGALVFHNESLGEAAAEFNRYGGAKLVVVGSGVAALTVNGTFRTNGADEFAGVAHEIFGLRVARSDDGIILSR